MAVRWRPRQARRAGAAPGSDVSVAWREPGPEQAWRSAPPVRRRLSEPVATVVVPGFIDRLATWRLAKMTVATRPASTWTSLTPLTQAAWTRRRSGVRTSPGAGETGPGPGPARSRSAIEPGADPSAVTRLTARPPREAAAHAGAGLDPLATLNRPTGIDLRAPAPPIPPVAGGPVAGPLRLASAAGMPGANRRDRPQTGLGPALPGLPRSARPLIPDRGEPQAPITPGTLSALGALDDSGWPGLPGRPGPLGWRGSPTGTAPAPADVSAYPRAGIGPVLASLPITARPLSPVVGGSPPPLPASPLHSSRPTGPAPTGAGPETPSGAQPPGHGLPVVHRFEQAGQAGPAAALTARFAPAPARSSSAAGTSVPGGSVPPGHVTIGSSGQRFASAGQVRPVDSAALAREIAQRHGDELAQAVAPALARLLRPPRDRSAERDELHAELPR
jgi:hypothetical protein